MVYTFLKLSVDDRWVSVKELSDELHKPVGDFKKVLGEAVSCGLVRFKDVEGFRYFQPVSRIGLALYAVKLGLNVGMVSRALNWREFEAMCVEALNANGYKTYSNFRFTYDKRRFEIDVAALSKPLVLCIDAKDWSVRSGKPYALRAVVDRHVERVHSLALKLPYLRRRLGLGGWGEASLTPLIVTLLEKEVKVHNGVAVVPIFKFNSFLHELPFYIDVLMRERVKLP